MDERSCAVRQQKGSMRVKEGSAQYFAQLDRKLQEKYGDWVGFRVIICNRIVELCFPDEFMRDAAIRSLREFVTEDTGVPNATFFYWNDTSVAYSPKSDKYVSGSLPVDDGHFRLIGSDSLKRRFYFTWPRPNGEDFMIFGRTLPCLFSRWASANDLIMIHAAVVGQDEKGVLVAGRSGTGKTTFAASCLAQGLDFISDDYALLSATGDLTAMPLYSIVAISPDMFTKFQALEELSIPPRWVRPDGKIQLTIPRDRIAESLAVKAVIIPVIGGESEPSIRQTARGPAMVHMLQSSAAQVFREKDTGLIQQMGRRLADLPVYEMRMSQELEKNPAVLREFIEKTF